ncbi:MAG: Uma2 family endonuclease, partial [Cyanobacteria bacterium CRU_2_1]|nr:Uma2 family endonuclease [Cyanobacteria bacterium CRU_2_1]
GGGLTIHVLQQGQYVTLNHSPTFANLPLTQLPDFLQQSNQIGEAQMLKAFRAWVRKQVQP